MGEHYVRKLCAALRGGGVWTWCSPANVHAETAKELATYTAGVIRACRGTRPGDALRPNRQPQKPRRSHLECDVPGFMQPFSRWLTRLANCGMWPPCTHPIER